jgi:pyruvate dehydrogenase E1 component alpha subunit
MPLDPAQALRMMMRIRAFETALAQRSDHGFQLLSSGEEAVAVGLASALRAKDQLLTGGRAIGLALARGVHPGRLMAELLGKSAGPNRGRAGRGHISDPSAGFFGAHAVVGGNISVAAGVALAKAMEGDGSLTVVVFGDGACGAGALHETLNMAAIWQLPLLFVCSNNRLSVSTAREAALAPARLSDIAAGFGLRSSSIDGLDVRAVAQSIGAAAASIRSGAGPAFVECRAMRLCSHSTNARETRPRDELATLRAQCPIAQELARQGLDASAAAALACEAEAGAAEALAFADASPYPSADEVTADVG